MDATHGAKADIEAIKQLKADYFRLLDSKQWRAWGELFTEDAVSWDPVGSHEARRIFS